LNSPREIFEQQFKAAAAAGAVSELYMRLLADKVPELQRSAYGKELKDVEALIIVRFAAALSDDEKALLRLCRQLRNKILHCDFHSARQKLQELGANPQSGNVRTTDIGGLSGKEMAKKNQGCGRKRARLVTVCCRSRQPGGYGVRLVARSG
jgi:hypothetical protein